MSRINLNTFRPDLSPTEVYNIVNTMALDYIRFSNNSHYFGRLFGVLTGDDRYGDFDDLTINECLREAIWRTLSNVQEQTERLVGIDLSERYRTEEIDWTWGNNYRTFRPGIDLVDIEPSWTSLLGFNAISVSPFVQINATVTATPGVGNVVTLDGTVVDNPNNVILRDNTDNHIYPIKDASPTYPKKVGNDWEIVLDDSVINYAPGSQINVQHVKYVYVDITDPVCADGTIYPVYPDTNQKIPEAKPREAIGNDTRYWFYIYTLVDPNFYDEVTNLQQGEFYKLLPAIEFKCFKEIESKAVLLKTCLCDNCICSDKEYQVTTKIEDAARGIVSFCIDGEIVNNVLVPISGCCPINDDGLSRYRLTFKYKTSTDKLPPKYVGVVGTLIRAIAHKVAADLPIADCGCTVKRGFIFEQQQAFGTIKFNPITGEKTESFKYGDLQGQRIYADVVTKIPLNRPIIL